MDRFPHNAEDNDRNPSIRLFGRRFSGDSQPMNVLAELLLVAASRKEINGGPGQAATADFFPDDAGLSLLKGNATSLVYYPKAHLNLKLFAFFGASPLSTRHRVHQEHAEELQSLLRQRADLPVDGNPNEILQTISSLLLGFLGNGAGRTWCAQTFLPFHQSLLCREAIWEKKGANNLRNDEWDVAVRKQVNYSKHEIFDRSGEALYLQLCNAFSRTEGEVSAWLAEDDGVKQSLRNDETDPSELKASFCRALHGFLEAAPQGLAPLLEFIDTGVDSETAAASDCPDGTPRKAECGWIPEESWKEGYLFAVEVKRLLSAKLDPMEKLDLFEAACSLQIMRTLVRQACRHFDLPESGLSLLLCDAVGASRGLKTRSAQSIQEIAKTLKLAIRIPEIRDVSVEMLGPEADASDIAGLYKEADEYGCGLYRKIGKSLGLIVPPKGRAMKATLNERLLRCLVLTLVPEERATLASFKARVKAHHGFVFDPDGKNAGDEWLERLLEAAGMLVRLSDACSLVLNPFA